MQLYDRLNYSDKADIDPICKREGYLLGELTKKQKSNPFFSNIAPLDFVCYGEEGYKFSKYNHSTRLVKAMLLASEYVENKTFDSKYSPGVKFGYSDQETTKIIYSQSPTARESNKFEHDNWINLFSSQRVELVDEHEAEEIFYPGYMEPNMVRVTIMNDVFELLLTVLATSSTEKIAAEHIRAGISGVPDRTTFLEGTWSEKVGSCDDYWKDTTIELQYNEQYDYYRAEGHLNKCVIPPQQQDFIAMTLLLYEHFDFKTDSFSQEIVELPRTVRTDVGYGRIRDPTHFPPGSDTITTKRRIRRNKKGHKRLFIERKDKMSYSWYDQFKED